MKHRKTQHTQQANKYTGKIKNVQNSNSSQNYEKNHS